LKQQKKRPPVCWQALCDPFENACLASGSAGYATDVAAIDAKIIEFAIAHAAKLGDCLTILAPIVESACYVHDNPLSWAFEAQLPEFGASVASMTCM
jgi:hypothetical protein